MLQKITAMWTLIQHSLSSQCLYFTYISENLPSVMFLIIFKDRNGITQQKKIVDHEFALNHIAFSFIKFVDFHYSIRPKKEQEENIYCYCFTFLNTFFCP